MILLLIPVVAVMLGLGLWVGLRGLGALNVPGGEPSTYLPPATASQQQPQVRQYEYMAPSGAVSRSDGRFGSTLWGRAADIPQGWLFAVIGLSGVWILGWLILLIVGLSLLS